MLKMEGSYKGLQFQVGFPPWILLKWLSNFHRVSDTIPDTMCNMIYVQAR